MINLFCVYFGVAGFNVHSKNFAHCLNKIEPVALVPLNYPHFPVDQIPEAYEMMSRPVLHDNVSIALSFGHLMQNIFGKQKIGYTVWETTKMPASWIKALNQMDQVWVPSNWGREIFSQNGIDKVKIQIVPEGVDPSIFHPDNEPLPDFKEKRFRFLYIGKWEERKGTEHAIRAYCKAFKPTDEVELVLNAFNPFIKNFNLKKEFFKLGITEHPPISFVDYLPLDKLAKLYASANAFMLPTKAEGWGLPIIEAMASGLPVIVTDYSAHTDFVNEDIGYLIKVKKMIEVKDPHFFNPDVYCGDWALPDEEHLIELLRYVYSHQSEARAKGLTASEHVRTNFSWQKAAEKAYHCINVFL